MLKRLIRCSAIAVVTAAAAGCDNSATTPTTPTTPTSVAQSATPKPSPQPPAPPPRRHFYEFNEGVEYGYSAAISADQQQAGVATNQVMMVRYAGMRDGKYQVHMVNGDVVTAIECSAPCEVMKLMSFVDAEYLRDQVTVQRFRFSFDSLGGMAISDAIRGELHQYGVEVDGKSYQLWVEEKRGYRRYPVASKNKDTTP